MSLRLLLLLRLPLAVLACLLTAGSVAFAAFTAATDSDANSVTIASTFATTQAAGTAGCFSNAGTGGCATARELDGPEESVVAPDGKHLYVASSTSNAITVFSRNADTGALTQLAGTAGCWSDTGANGCSDGHGLTGPGDVAVSPDGLNVYSSAGDANGSLAIFSRNPTTGALTQLAGQAGCISSTGNGGACATGTAMTSLVDVTVSPDGKSVYAVSAGDNSVVVLDRDASTGALTQQTGVWRCVSETGSGGSCIDGRALDGPRSVTVSPDNTHVYVASIVSDAVAVFSRNTLSGVIGQNAGTAGCVSESGHSGTCVDGRVLNGARAVVVSPDGTQVFVAAYDASSVAILRRSGTNALVQDPGGQGCVSEAGASSCTTGQGMAGATDIAVDPGGQRVWVAGTLIHAVAILYRGSTGTITRPADPAACVSDSGTTSLGAVCVDGHNLLSARSVAPSPDGRFLYVAAPGSDAIAILAR